MAFGATDARSMAIERARAQRAGCDTLPEREHAAKLEVRAKLLRTSIIPAAEQSMA